jgi:hypothetical protein
MRKQFYSVSALMLSLYQKKYFMLDPSFPQWLLQLGNRHTIEFIQFLFTEYSKHGLTYETDRRTAICDGLGP